MIQGIGEERICRRVLGEGKERALREQWIGEERIKVRGSQGIKVCKKRESRKGEMKGRGK